MIFLWVSDGHISYQINRVSVKDNDLYIRMNKRHHSVGIAMGSTYCFFISVKKNDFDGDKVIFDVRDTLW